MEDQPQLTQQQFAQLDSPDNQITQKQPQVEVGNPLKHLYQQLQGTFNQQAASNIRSFMKYRENRTYHVFVNDKAEYFGSMWQHLQEKLSSQSPLFEGDLLELISNRNSNILSEIMESRLQIEPKPRLSEANEEEKNRKVNLLREQSTEIQRKLLDINADINDIRSNENQTSQSRFKPFEINEAKVKEYEQFIRKQKKEKEERAKLIEEQRKKEEQMRQKREEEEKEARERMIKQKKEELLKKMRESEEKRNKSKSEREQRIRQYKAISKSLAEQPPLFKKLEEKYYSRYEQLENEKRQKVMSERLSMYQQLDNKSLEQHEKKYEEMRLERQRQRKERQEEFQKMLELQQEQLQAKFKSNYESQKDFVDVKEVEKKLGLEKKERVKRYIEETVKERYLPRIDEEKRKEFLRMIEDLSKKKVKKVKKEDGSFEYEEVRPSDPRMVGLEYLQKTKEMAAKMRGKRKNSDQIAAVQSQKPKIIDYLQEMRKKGTSKSNRDRLSFMNRKGISFDQKLKKVELQSEKLQQLAHQKEMKLKFGKFGTSDQILQHKEQIDQQYIDIINMKLKLINHKED